MKRFEALWAAWDEGSARGCDPAARLPLLSDEEVVELLAGAPESRRNERNLLATEALNRMTRTRRALVEVAHDVSADTQEVLRLVEESAQGAADEDAMHGASLDYDARNAAREAAIEHIQSIHALGALERASNRLELLRKDALAHTRDPELFERASQN